MQVKSERREDDEGLYRTCESKSLSALFLLADLSFNLLLLPRGLCMYTSATHRERARDRQAKRKTPFILLRLGEGDEKQTKTIA